MNRITEIGLLLAGVSCQSTANQLGADFGMSDAGEPTSLRTPRLATDASVNFGPDLFEGSLSMPDAEVVALPACTGYPAVAFPSPLVNFSMLPSNGPTAHEGTATVTLVQEDGAGVPFGVKLEWTDTEGSISLQNTGTLFPRFVVGQVVDVNLLATSEGIIAQSVVIIHDPVTNWMIASYNFADVFIRDGSVERLLGFDIRLREICEGNSNCSWSPTRFITGTAVIEGRELELPIGQVVTATIGGRDHELIWRGGQSNAGPSTGNCADAVFGSSLAFLVLRQ